MYCMECGKEIIADAKFCGKCGALVDFSALEVPAAASGLSGEISVPHSSPSGTIGNRQSRNLITSITQSWGIKEWAGISILIVVSFFALKGFLKHPDNFDAINDHQGLQGNIKGFVYEKDQKTIARLSSIHLFNATPYQMSLADIQLTIGGFVGIGSSKYYPSIDDSGSIKLPLNIILKPKEEITIDFANELASPLYGSINEQFFLNFHITEKDKTGFWSFASDKLGKPLDYANYSSVTSINHGKLSKVQEKEQPSNQGGNSNYQGGDSVASYANQLASELERHSYPACTFIANNIRSFGNSGQPDYIRKRQVDSLFNHAPSICLQ